MTCSNDKCTISEAEHTRAKDVTTRKGQLSKIARGEILLWI